MRNEVSSSNPTPPENVAIAIGWPLNKFLKSSPEIYNHAMKLERIGGIDPLYSGAHIIHFSARKSLSLIFIISVGMFSLLWVRGLNNGISKEVKSNISAEILSVLLLSRNVLESSRFLPQLAEIIIRFLASVIN